jgi:cell division protein ZapA
LEELSIKVNIADRTYPLKVSADQEETVRKAARLINDKMKELQLQFAVKDKQDILSMILLEEVTLKLSAAQQHSAAQAKIKAELQEMQQLLGQIKV